MINEEMGDANDADATRYYGGWLVAESIFSPEDANLIAAAPELLEALIAVWNAYKASRNAEDCGERISDLIDQCIVAVEKAEGETR